MTIDNKNLKLLPFDIEKALAGDPVVRYDGKEGKIVFVSDKEECLFRILFVVTDEKDDDVGYFADWFRINGNNEDDDPALFMLPKTKTMWMAYDPNQELHGCLAASSLFPAEEKLLNSWGNEIKNKGWKITTVEVEV